MVLKKAQEENSPIIQNKINIELSISKHIPYFGGEAPTEEQLYIITPIQGTFILTDFNGLKKEVKSNEKGIIKLNIAKDKYQLQEQYKSVNFDTFYKRESKNKSQFIMISDSICYRKWWSKKLITFEVKTASDLTKFSGKVFSNCYTTSSCETYTGPYKP